jgi:hypothetical protein
MFNNLLGIYVLSNLYSTVLVEHFGLQLCCSVSKALLSLLSET